MLTLDNCFVCSETIGACRNQLAAVTSFTETPIHEVLGKYF